VTVLDRLPALLLAFSITWSPGLRGILVVAVGVVVLLGSLYLLLATNVGARVGFLVAFAGFWGWMMLMGLVWALYGIGYKGPAPSWKVEEVVVTEDAADLSGARLAEARALEGWTSLPDGDPSRGEAQAAASALLVSDQSPLGDLWATEADFKVLAAYDKGGKGGSFLEGWLPGPHPPHWTIIQVQGVKDVVVPFGQTPPPSEVDPASPVASIILVRDLGALRLPSVTLTIASAIIFGLTCNALHRRDKALAAARAAGA
jgi:hypothetical protein